MIKTFTFTSVLMILTFISYSQSISWEPTRGPSGSYVRSVLYDNYGNLFAGTGSGLFKSTNSGENWSLSENGISNILVYSLASSPSGTIFAGTFDAGIYRSTDDGNSWTQKGTNVYFIVWALAVDSSGNIFAGTTYSENGGGGSVYRSTDDGNTWVEVNNGLPDSPVNQIQVSSDNSVFVGMENGFFKSTNSGTSWTSLSSVIPITWISDIAVNPLNNFIYVSGFYPTGSSSALFRSTDNGDSFTQLNFPDTLARILGVNSLGHLFAAVIIAFPPSLNYRIYRSTDNGATFTYVDSVLLVNRFAFGSSNQNYAGTNLGVQISTDDGLTWNLKTSGMTGISVVDISTDQSNTIYAGSLEGPYRTTDEGVNWDWLHSGQLLRSVVSMTTNSQGDLFMINNLGFVIRSTDMGETWTQLPVEVLFGVIYAHTNDMLFLSSAFQGVQRSTDNGDTWTTVIGSPENIVTFASDTNGNIYAGSSFDGLYRSTNNGNSWTQLGSYAGYIDMMAVNASQHLFWGYGNSNLNYIYRSTDEGATWVRLSVTPSDSGVVRAIFITPDQDIYIAIGEGSVGGVYRSTDDGNTFTSVSDGLTDKWLTSFGMESNGHLLAGTTMGVYRSIESIFIPIEIASFIASVSGNDVDIFWTTATETNNKGFEVQRSNNDKKFKTISFVEGSGTTTQPHSYSFIDNENLSGTYIYRLKQIDFDGSFRYSKEAEVHVNVPLKFSLSQNSPNPFNPSTIIKYSVPHSSQVQIKIFDVLGNEIETLVNEEKPAGTYKMTWIAANLSSGIYFYQLRAGDFVQTKKMILLK